jgi:hypothetical protein
MATERPLDEARLRIAARKKEESIIPVVEKEKICSPIPETPYNEIAEDRFVFHILPLSMRELIGDVVHTIESREKITLVSQNSFDFSTNNTKKMARLLEKGKNPIKSGTFSYEKTIIEKGAVHKRIVFGPVSPIEEKSPDKTYKVFLEISYNDRDKSINWIMGDPAGPELKFEPEKIEKNYKYILHDGHVKGSIKYSEENMLTLAENLVTQIDLERYKYQVREMPIMQLQEG